jgi:nitrite reductase (NADH) large subunit
MATYIIIGNSIAANAAAESIRKADSRGDILMFSKEKAPFYYVPALPEYLSGEKSLETITLHDRQWYGANNIQLRLDTEITAVDPAARTVSTKNGDTYSYERLLLATGGYSFIPPIKGADQDGVYALRTIADAEVIKKKAAASRDLVLIGGGLLGLEAGNGLRKAGLRVSVIEFFPRLLPRQMDPAGAAILRQQMEAMGFSFYLNAKTKEILREGSRLSVALESGEKIPADMVLVSAGVRPEVALAKSIGLDIDKALKVDDAMQTARDTIYAAGDVIEHRGAYYGIWPAAMEQGAVAGSNMAGGSAQYQGTVMANTLKVVGISLSAAGDIDADGKLESLVTADAAQGIYRKLVIKDDVLAGVILFGDSSGSSELIDAVKNRKNIASLEKDIMRPGFDFTRLR